MSFTVNLAADPAVPMWTADRRLCMTEDGVRVVDENDPAARWLWAVEGREMPMSEAIRLGAVQDPNAEAVEPQAETETEAADNEAPAGDAAVDEAPPKPVAKRATAKPAAKA